MSQQLVLLTELERTSSRKQFCRLYASQLTCGAVNAKEAAESAAWTAPKQSFFLRAKIFVIGQRAGPSRTMAHKSLFSTRPSKRSIVGKAAISQILARHRLESRWRRTGTGPVPRSESSPGERRGRFACRICVHRGARPRTQGSRLSGVLRVSLIDGPSAKSRCKAFSRGSGPCVWHAGARA